MRTLITGALGATEAELDMLRSSGLEITLFPDERRKVEHPEQYEAVICNGLFLYNNIQEFTSLKYIQLTSAGLDRVPVEYIRSHGIELHNASGVYSIPMAEWTIMRILELYKNADRLYENQVNHRWEKDRTWKELAGKTACIVGYGAYGAETAKRLKAFDVKVLAVNRTAKESQWVDAFFPLEQLECCLGQADIVILAIALTDATRQLMNKARLNSMKPGAILINAARGGLIDEAALLEALKCGRISGAALDVFEIEPQLNYSKFLGISNVLLSPHNSFISNNNHLRLIKHVYTDINEFFRKRDE